MGYKSIKRGTCFKVQTKDFEFMGEAKLGDTFLCLGHAKNANKVYKDCYRMLNLRTLSEHDFHVTHFYDSLGQAYPEFEECKLDVKGW
jgi:hypothetical protein